MLRAILLSFAPAVLAAATPLSATIDPAVVGVGEPALLTITTLGSDLAPTLPVVPNLDMRITQQSRRMEIIHGATVSTNTFVVRVTARAPGTYAIPGVSPSSQPLILRVNPEDTGGNSRPSKLPGTGGSSAIPMAADGSAFVRMLVPKTEVYVGESVPIDIEVGMRAGFVTSVNGLPTLEGSDFTLNNLSRKPERVEKVIDGSRFAVLTWHSALAVIKPGAFSLSVEVPLTLKIRSRPKQESLLEDQLGDPFLQNIFGASVHKDVQIKSPALPIVALALPEGRPADFSGAVGNFKIESSLSATAAGVGEPLTLRMKVIGAGNFDRVDSAMLEHVEQWKTYPPTAHFTPQDAIGYKGEKLFEQPLIASQPGVQTLPGLVFNYFDPATRHYETARSERLSVTVAPAAGAAASEASPAAPSAGKPTWAVKAAQGGLRPDHPLTEAPADSLMPLYLRPAFLAIPSVLGLAFAGAWFALRRTTLDRPSVARRRRPSKAVIRELERMETAARAGDAVTFLRAAQAALAQADARSDEIRQLFALADEAKYSGRAPAALDFARWTRVVREHGVQVVLLAVLLMGGWQAHAESPAPDGTAAHPASGDPSPALSAAALYNQANAAAREGRTGMAVLNYERARLLAPDDADIEANLRYVRKATGLPDESASRIAGLGQVARPTLLAWIGLAGMVIAGAALLAATRWPRRRWLCAAASLIGVALLGLTLCNAVLVWPALHEAVVVAASAPARVAPAPLGDPLFTLPEGDTVRMTAEHEGFLLVKTSKGQTGWVAQAELAPVVPRD
jgi:hypothetical protein